MGLIQLMRNNDIPDARIDTRLVEMKLHEWLEVPETDTPAAGGHKGKGYSTENSGGKSRKAVDSIIYNQKGRMAAVCGVP